MALENPSKLTGSNKTKFALIGSSMFYKKRDQIYRKKQILFQVLCYLIYLFLLDICHFMYHLVTLNQLASYIYILNLVCRCYFNDKALNKFIFS